MFRKELQLQQVTLLGIGCLFVLHLGVVALRKAGAHSFSKSTRWALEMFGVVWLFVPLLAGVFTLVMLASIGVPGLNGFVGEFLILAGTFLTHRWWAVVATGGVILAAVYLLWAYQQAFHGKPKLEPGAIRDLSLRESLVLAPLVILIVLLGVFPGPLLNRIGPSVTRVVAHVETVAHQRPPQIGTPGTALRQGSKP